MEVGLLEPGWRALPFLSLCLSILSPFSCPPQSEHVQPCSQTWEPPSLLLCLLLGLFLSALCPLSTSASLLHDACSLTPPGISGRENLWNTEPWGVEWLQDSKKAGPWPWEDMGGDGGFSETWPESAGQRPGGERVTLSCEWVRGTVWTQLTVSLSESPTPSSSSDTVYVLGLTDLCRPPPSSPFLLGLHPLWLLPFHLYFHWPSELWFQSLWLRIVLRC